LISFFGVRPAAIAAYRPRASISIGSGNGTRDPAWNLRSAPCAAAVSGRASPRGNELAGTLDVRPDALVQPRDVPGLPAVLLSVGVAEEPDAVRAGEQLADRAAEHALGLAVPLPYSTRPGGDLPLLLGGVVVRELPDVVDQVQADRLVRVVPGDDQIDCCRSKLAQSLTC
jgi:hypothetical protein